MEKQEKQDKHNSLEDMLISLRQLSNETTSSCEPGEGTFEPSNIYAQVDEHQTEKEDGYRIFEWQISVEDVARWLRAVRAG